MKYTPDHVGTGMYLRFDGDLRHELERRAHLGVAVGAALAPRRTGALARSGHVEYGGPTGGVHHDRMEFSVVFDVPYAAAATWPGRTAYLEAVKAAMEAGS